MTTTSKLSTVQNELNTALWLSDFDAKLTRRQADRLPDSTFAIMGLGMLVTTLAAVCAACASLSGGL